MSTHTWIGAVESMRLHLSTLAPSAPAPRNAREARRLYRDILKALEGEAPDFTEEDMVRLVEQASGHRPAVRALSVTSFYRKPTREEILSALRSLGTVVTHAQNLNGRYESPASKQQARRLLQELREDGLSVRNSCTVWYPQYGYAIADSGLTQYAPSTPVTDQLLSIAASLSAMRTKTYWLPAGAS